MLAVLTSSGELLVLLWLLMKGVNVKQWEKRALASPDVTNERIHKMNVSIV
jgi:hypothetical protein